MKFVLIMASAALAAGCASKPISANYILESPIEIKGRPGSFDFIAYDFTNRQIVAAHKGAKSAEIFDATSNQSRSVDVGDAQGVAIDSSGGRYFFGSDQLQSIIAVDSKRLTKINELKVDGPIDAMAFNEKSGLLYVAKDDGDRLWIVDPGNMKLVSEVMIPGIPETMQLDLTDDRLYLNLKNTDSVAVINMNTNKVESTISTFPAKRPHGLVLDTKRRRLYSAGQNGKMVAIDLQTKNVISETDIAGGNDQIAYDSDRDQLYTSGHGELSVVQVSDRGFAPVETVKTPKSAHTLVFDKADRAVWLAYGDEEHSFFQRIRR